MGNEPDHPDYRSLPQHFIELRDADAVGAAIDRHWGDSSKDQAMRDILEELDVEWRET